MRSSRSRVRMVPSSLLVTDTRFYHISVILRIKENIYNQLGGLRLCTCRIGTASSCTDFKGVARILAYPLKSVQDDDLPDRRVRQGIRALRK